MYKIVIYGQIIFGYGFFYYCVELRSQSLKSI